MFLRTLFPAFFRTLFTHVPVLFRCRSLHLMVFLTTFSFRAEVLTPVVIPIPPVADIVPITELADLSQLVST